MIKWNENVRLILADVDDTICPPGELAIKPLLDELSRILEERIALFLVTGSPVVAINQRIVDHIDPSLRSLILVADNNGTEVWGYDQNGHQLEDPFYSMYEDRLTNEHKQRFREVAERIVKEFGLRTYPMMTYGQFEKESGGDPLAVIFDDRRAQITLGVRNAIDLNPNQLAILEIKVPKHNGRYDLRHPIMDRLNELFDQYDIPVSARLGGRSAIDMTVKDVSKTTAVEYILHQKDILKERGLDSEHLLSHSDSLEIWGDRYSQVYGTDWLMCAAVDKSVRAIDFRDEDPAEFPLGYNITIWDGDNQLCDGVLEYLISRHKVS